MEGRWDVANRGENDQSAGSLEGVEEVDEGRIKGVKGDERIFEGSEELAGVHLDEADKEVDTGGESILPDAIFGE